MAKSRACENKHVGLKTKRDVAAATSANVGTNVANSTPATVPHKKNQSIARQAGVKSEPLGVKSGPNASRRPVWLDWTAREKDASAIPVLYGAFETLVKHGWCRPYDLADIGNRPLPPGMGLIEAVRSVVGPVPPANHYAERILRLVVGDVLAWERHPLRTGADVLRAIQRALGALGATPPLMPKPAVVRRAGGWTVSP